MFSDCYGQYNKNLKCCSISIYRKKNLYFSPTAISVNNYYGIEYGK